MKILKSKTHCAIQPLLFGCADNSLLQTATSNNIKESQSLTCTTTRQHKGKHEKKENRKKHQ